MSKKPVGDTLGEKESDSSRESDSSLEVEGYNSEDLERAAEKPEEKVGESGAQVLVAGDEKWDEK